MTKENLASGKTCGVLSAPLVFAYSNSTDVIEVWTPGEVVLGQELRHGSEKCWRMFVDIMQANVLGGTFPVVRESAHVSCVIAVPVATDTIHPWTRNA
jgi:hypothetical protein